MNAEISGLDRQQLVAEATACAQAVKAAACRLLQIAAAWADAQPADGVVHQHTLLAQAGERTMQSDVPVWQARRVASRTRTLTADQPGQVDTAVAASLGNLSGKRLDHLLDAEILRADRERVEADTERAKRTRRVSIGQSSENGLKDLYARLDAPDAIWFDGSVDALADILAANPDRLPAGVPDRNPQSKPEWRAVAMAVLARPFVAAQIWADHAQPDLFTNPELIKSIDPTKLQPRAVLHVHINRDALQAGTQHPTRPGRGSPASKTSARTCCPPSAAGSVPAARSNWRRSSTATKSSPNGLTTAA